MGSSLSTVLLYASSIKLLPLALLSVLGLAKELIEFIAGRLEGLASTRKRVLCIRMRLTSGAGAGCGDFGGGRNDSKAFQKSPNGILQHFVSWNKSIRKISRYVED